MEDVKEVLHLYMGCAYITSNSQGNVNPTTLPLILKYWNDYKNFQLVVRRLDSMTEEEDTDFTSINQGFAIDEELRPSGFVWLLKRGFWLLDNSAFDKGLIIDSKTLNKEA